MSLNMGFGGSSSSSSTSYTPTKATKNLFYPVWNQAQQIASNSANPYGGQLSAGLDPMQQQAAGMAKDNIGAGKAAVGSAVGGAQAVQGYNPQQVHAQSLGGTDLSQYLNPYMDSVAGGVLGQLNRGREMAINGQAGDFTKAGAFGGSRHGVADAETNRAFADTASNALNNIYSQGFGNAQQAAQFDIGNNLNAQGMNQQAGLSGAGLNLNASGLLGQLGAQQQQMGANDALLVNQFGQQAQQNQQGALDRAYAEFQRQYQDPMTGLTGLLGNIGALYSGARQNGSSSGTQWGVSGGVSYGGGK
jgi:hypothetical protein